MPAKKQDQTGFTIKGNVNIKNGDLVAGNKTISVHKGGVFTGGNVAKSAIVTGDHNQTANFSKIQNNHFEKVFKKIERRSKTTSKDKQDLKTNVDEIKAEAQKGEKANQSFLAKRLQNIEKIAPDIVDVVIATLTSPATGFALVVKKVAEKAAAKRAESSSKG